MKRIIYYFFCLVAAFALSKVSAEDRIDIAAIYSITGAAAADNAPSVQGSATLSRILIDKAVFSESE